MLFTQMAASRVYWLVAHVGLATQLLYTDGLFGWAVYMSVQLGLAYTLHLPCWSKPASAAAPTLSRHCSAVDDCVTSAMHFGLSMVRQLRHTCWFVHELALSTVTGKGNHWIDDVNEGILGYSIPDRSC